MITLRPAAACAAMAILAWTAPAAAADQRDKSVLSLVFDLCPKVLADDEALRDPALLAAIGFTSTAPRETPTFKEPRAEKGSGSDRIVLAGGGSHGCSIWLGGSDTDRLTLAVMQRAQATGYRGGRVFRTGGGIDVAVLLDSANPGRSLSIIGGDGGGEIGIKPAVTIVMMDKKGN